MKKLSSSYMLRVATLLLILLAVAKAISLAVWWFLPSDGVELQVKDNYKPKYQRVDFKNMLNAGIRTKNDSKTYQDSSASGISITNMVLKGLYGKGSKGFAIVALKSSLKKTSIVSVGEVFSGYTLKTILNDGVIFTKSSKEYVLKMLHSKITKESVMSSVQSSEPKGISRADIDFYSKNPKEITLAEIIRLMDGALAPVGSVSKYFYEATPIDQNKSLLKLFKEIRDYSETEGAVKN